MHRTPILPFLAVLVSFSCLSHGAESVPPNEHLKLNPWTGEGFNLGGVLFPRVSYQAAAGSSTTDPASLATGHHDPDRHGITQQDIEFALSAKLGKHLRLSGIYAAKIDQDDHWHGEFEEYYAELVGLPFDSALKGGRFYTKFGYDNSDHPHAYTFVDKFLAPGRLIGEDSATIYGGQISLPVLGRVLPIGWSDRLSFSFGSVPEAEEHEHEHGEEHEEPTYEGERAAWTDNLATLDYTLSYSPRKAVSYQAGVSAAWGQNDFDRQTQLYGAHFQYLWRPSGAAIPDSGHDDIEKGEFFRWRTEVYVRHFGAEGTEEEEYEKSVVVPGEPAHYRTERRERRVFIGGSIRPFYRFIQTLDHPAIPAYKATATSTRQRTVRDDFTDAGFYTSLTYGFPSGHVQTHLRAEYVSGLAEAGLPERYRISPAITLRPSISLPIHFKLQYNYDHLPAFGDEHSVWAQFNLAWGDSCSHAH
jgi:hypothetical protein